MIRRARRWLPATALFFAVSSGSALVLAETQSAAHSGSGAADHAQAGEHGHDAAPSLDDFNWFYGFLGEKEGAEPSLLYRPKGMPVPFGAMLLNSAVLYVLIFKLAKKPVMDGLRRRKETILRGMEEAARMKREAEVRLAEYTEKLERIDEEVARVRREMREAADAERQRVLAEAREKRERMERDARLLIDHELRAARQRLMIEMVEGAIRSAQAQISSRITVADQERLAEEYLGEIRGLKPAVGPRGVS